jgi:putative aldouronate transport system permease protein
MGNISSQSISNQEKRSSKLRKTFRHIKRDRQLLIIFLPCALFYAIFRYGPMFGLIMSFQDYGIFLGYLKSPWVGLKHFIKFFNSPDFLLLFKNTFLLGLYTLLWTFPFPIIFAIFLNEIRNAKFKKSIQTLSFLPSFLSVVIVSSMVIDFLSPGRGIINTIIEALGFEPKYFIIDPKWFRTIFIASEIWSTMGYSAIIYLAAIAGVDQTLYEAARVDGSSRLKSIWYITLPSILPTIATMFILKSGAMFSIGYEKVLLLYTPTTYKVADVFSTYVYRKGLLERNYSYAAAVGLFESIVALTLLLITNKISKKLTEQSLW